ncbi:MAG: (2Fe-2S)-binding protein [Deltaproteobacteria bacterium]|nr:MAG: (2Fe-2S)-binding protein [Deltaproteobacteria bacterium]
MNISFDINGRRCEVDVDPLDRLLDVLRRDLGLTGTKEGCGEGECGACTVLVDGDPVNACLVPVAQIAGRAVVTVEGVAADGVLADVQRALIDHGAAQCGICTPGIVLCAIAALDREPGASRARIRELLAGNLCRCTGYQRIVDAVADAQARRRGR